VKSSDFPLHCIDGVIKVQEFVDVVNKMIEHSGHATTATVQTDESATTRNASTDVVAVAVPVLL
jgi:hypothetical protein